MIAEYFWDNSVFLCLLLPLVATIEPTKIQKNANKQPILGTYSDRGF